jgi:hypothetical protein
MNQYLYDNLANLLQYAGNPIKKYEIPMDEEGNDFMTVSKYKGLSQRGQVPMNPQSYLLSLLMRRGGR